MKRRQALIGIAAMAAFDSFAQRPSKPPVVGLLDGGERLAWWAAFRRQMLELGYEEGKNLVLEPRFAKGRFEHLPALAQELVRLNVDVIVTSASVASQAAGRATDRIPIVTATGADHVSQGFAVSLARPGGNITGVSSIATELTGKRLELLREILPRMSRLALLWQTGNVGSMPAVRDLETASRASKLTLQNLGIKRAEDLTGAIATATRERVEALFVVLGPLIYGVRQQIGELALKNRLPTMHGGAEMVEAGGLISYGVNYPDLFRRAAVYVDKILKGAKAGDLPIEQPTKFETIINIRTAKALGVTIAQTMLVRADRVID